MENIKKNIGDNLIDLRKRKNCTQQELADYLNYSDKSISKWERGESTPDIEILYKICEFFDVDLNYMITPKDDKSKEINIEREKKIQAYKVIITCLACLFIWIVAVTLFVTCNLIYKKNYWTIFLFALPVSIIILLIFNCIWGKMTWLITILSALVWTTLLSIFLQLQYDMGYIFWYIFLIGIPLQAAIILWHLLIKFLRKK